MKSDGDVTDVSLVVTKHNHDKVVSSWTWQLKSSGCWGKYSLHSLEDTLVLSSAEYKKFWKFAAQVLFRALHSLQYII